MHFGLPSKSYEKVWTLENAKANDSQVDEHYQLMWRWHKILPPVLGELQQNNQFVALWAESVCKPSKTYSLPMKKKKHLDFHWTKKNCTRQHQRQSYQVHKLQTWSISHSTHNSSIITGALKTSLSSTHPSIQQHCIKTSAAQDPDSVVFISLSTNDLESNNITSI